MRRVVFLSTIVLITSMPLLESCGPIIISPLPQSPPPTWFYPGRIETVRYVYFPAYLIYYDLSKRNYLYLENNIWKRAAVLPVRYRSIDLRRSKFVRVKGYREDKINTYHRRKYPSSPRVSRTSRTIGKRN